MRLIGALLNFVAAYTVEEIFCSLVYRLKKTVFGVFLIWFGSLFLCFGILLLFAGLFFHFAELARFVFPAVWTSLVSLGTGLVFFLTGCSISKAFSKC